MRVLTCKDTGKIAFASAHAAHEQRRVLYMRRDNTQARLEPYVCEFCGMWHLGRRKPEIRKRAPRWREAQECDE